MDYIQLTPENLEQEHICCAISDDKDPQVRSKKAWLKDRIAEGLVFLKAAGRGKCFIEYIPAEQAWVPIEADGYLYINCFWVSGAFKGHGYANDLLGHCVSDAKGKGKHGICVISSPKKRPFLSDPDYLAAKGFRVADTAEPFFSLLYLPLDDNAPIPKFKESVKKPHIDKQGFVLYYTAACPFTAKYVPLVEQVAKSAGIPCTTIFLDTKEKAQNAPVAWTTYALFHDGAYVTNEIQSEKKFLALASSMQRQPSSEGQAGTQTV